ncbi:MAG: MJ0042-type zinc finger domain-containing protein [Phycisphaeraceae bacterium]
MIEFTCPSCQTQYRVPMERAGSRGKCKKCGAVISVPSVSSDAPSAVPPPLPTDDPAAALAAAQVEMDASPPPLAGSTQRRWAHSRRFDAPIKGRPMSGHHEKDSRKLRLLALGIVLIVGFFVPSCVPDIHGSTQVVFFNIAGLVEEGIPIAVKLLLIYPLLAGGAVLIARAAMPPPMRGWLIFGVGLLPLVIVFAAEPTEVLRNLSRAMATGRGALGIIVGILGLIGFFAVWVGARSRYYRPDYAHTYIIGVVGAICLLLTLLIPQNGQMPLIAPFKALEYDAIGGIIMIVASIAMITASIICLCNTRSRRAKNISSLALLAFWVLLGGIIFTVTIGFFYSMTGGGRGLPVQALPFMFSTFIKTIFMAAVIAVTPIGLTDAVVGGVPVAGHCPDCGYDLQGNTSGACPECGRPT